MKCRCGGDTFVVDSRASECNSIRRRRQCEACGTRVTTWESTVKPMVVLKHRAAELARRKRWLNKNPERAEYRKAQARLYQQVRREAEETGETREQVKKRWGLT